MGAIFGRLANKFRRGCRGYDDASGRIEPRTGRPQINRSFTCRPPRSRQFRDEWEEGNDESAPLHCLLPTRRDAIRQTVHLGHYTDRAACLGPPQHHPQRGGTTRPVGHAVRRFRTLARAVFGRVVLLSQLELIVCPLPRPQVETVPERTSDSLR